MGNSHPPRLSRRNFLAAAGAAGIASIAGCVASGRNSPLEGDFTIDGSNTVQPHGTVLAEEFQWMHGNVIISIRGSGTGAGFQRFSLGETEIQNASRRISDGEQDQCRDNDIEWVELPALRDGIAIYKHPDNDWCDQLTMEQLEEIWERDSEIETWRDISDNWSDIDDDWPDEEISLYGRDSASGTFDFFTESVTGEVGNIRDDYSGTTDTNNIVRGVRGDEYAIGFGGAGYYYENEDDLGLIKLPADDGEAGTFVEPNEDTIRRGTYPLSRDMYLYINVEELQRTEVAAFVLYLFTMADDEFYADLINFSPTDEIENRRWTQFVAREVKFYEVDEETIHLCLFGADDGKYDDNEHGHHGGLLNLIEQDTREELLDYEDEGYILLPEEAHEHWGDHNE
ncbi:PstS family phosphate ABC transporter substrate-binding protein [Salinarchaeum sp. IM2453]|uniref:PstS family phosphate ABC transporter substrate-binding protein n=1 Tax=Salinarchaeum sp. IM2453 TaxID=2862870 RepID=UPI001C830809|nr:PstS family phosphate ABC transporter substrate-binding protein [Salinarchaeum sp. IM2453]QZA88650.1 PstS family phosphate ABC transporter substrate-binding protein [Salinarchaeum sp. IM2453]